MTNWPESFDNIPADFRAPPPSPIASGRRSSVANDEFLTEFLHHSLRVPDLILPVRVSPRQKSHIQKLPKLDFKVLESIEGCEISEKIDVIARIGCFEVVNHGIEEKLVRSVTDYGAGVFDLSPEKKAVLSRSDDRICGFVEANGEEKETSEEFVWCRDDSLKSKLEEMLPPKLSNISENLEILTSEIERICSVILKILLKNGSEVLRFDDDEKRRKRTAGSICYIYRNHQDSNTVQNESYYTNSLRSDMIRMLIRGCEHSHTLGVHLCNGSEFHVYSKKGWVSFCPEKDALVVTIGDQLQRWSEGKYKHVMGRQIFKGGDDYISMAFMYNPLPLSIPMKEKTVSISHQVLFLFILALFYKLYCNF